MNNSQPPLILSLETSTRTGGVAVLCGDNVLAEKAGEEKTSQSAQLLSDIREILKKNDLDLKQINLMAVAVGPGSFTGLRIGLASALALATALKIPIVGISSLEAAAACSDKDDKICAALPAGRSEYYVQSFAKSAAGKLEAISKIEIYNAQNLSKNAAQNNNLNWISTVEIIETIISTMKIPIQNYQILPENLSVPVGQIAHHVFLGGDLKKFPPRPIYVRDADIGKSKDAK